MNLRKDHNCWRRDWLASPAAAPERRQSLARVTKTACPVEKAAEARHFLGERVGKVPARFGAGALRREG